MTSTRFDAAARRPAWPIVLLIAAIALTAAIEVGMGRSGLGPDGRFGLWESDIWSSENSQRVADAYSFSHIVHGILFYGLLWLCMRRRPIGTRFTIALMLAAAWEVLENSSIVINRYREETIALGYFGDSVLNSCADIVMMALGFALAARVRPRVSSAMVVAMELGCLFWVRDNLTLRVIMLVHPIEAIRTWQSAGHLMP